jgi:hypothetical protein
MASPRLRPALPQMKSQPHGFLPELLEGHRATFADDRQLARVVFACNSRAR